MQVGSIVQLTHTPAPWSFLPKESDKEYIRVRGTKLGHKYKIANVHSMFPQEQKEDESNARLIAAAPELLALLIEATDDYATNCEGGESDEWVIHSRLVIAKATGQTA